MPGPYTIARQLWHVLEPIHAVTYFCPEPLQQLTAAGYRGFWMGYFAGRTAPLGAASAELVEAVCYNFSADQVRAAIPDAWTFAAPPAALHARLTGSTAALRRITGGIPAGIDQVNDILGRAVRLAPVAGRPLFAANAALPVPDDPVGQLWHHATLLREHRGDGHVAVLLSAGVSGRQAHVLHCLTTSTARETYRLARRFDDDEWAATLAGLHRRGLVDHHGRATTQGFALKAQIEEHTDALAGAAFANLDTADLHTCLAALRPIAIAVRDSGDLPLDTPMGLDLTEL